VGQTISMENRNPAVLPVQQSRAVNDGPEGGRGGDNTVRGGDDFGSICVETSIMKCNYEVLLLLNNDSNLPAQATILSHRIQILHYMR